METLRELGEFGLIKRLAATLPANDAVVTGIGDDCAVVRIGGQLLLVSCDASLENVHFSPKLAPPEAIGWKACASALSDIAAMGGQPRFALVTLACPTDTDIAFLERLYRGMENAAAACGAVIVGGDTARSPSGLMIDLMIVGEPSGKRYLCRRGAQAGDILAVTGWPGRAAAGLRALETGIHAADLIDAHLHPLPRIHEGQWLAKRPEAHAMIDLSDGLVQDAGRLAEAAALGIDLTPEALPVAPALATYQNQLGVNVLDAMLAGGEDYELAVALDAPAAQKLCETFVKHFSIPLAVVGRFTAQWTGVRIDGKIPKSTGYDHFRT